jgi:two-component system, OmpR family, sensor kinase
MTRLSLSARLVFLLAIGQTAVAVVGMAAWMLFSPFVTFVDVAGETSRALVAAALRIEDGTLRIVRTPDLAAYAETRPALRYAAFSAATALEGSDSTLARAVGALAPLLPRNGIIDTAIGENKAFVRLSSGPTAHGEIVVATVGDSFGRDDVVTFVTVFLAQLLPIFAPALLVAIAAMPIVVRLTMRPLIEAARDAELIDLGNIAKRFDVRTMPHETRAFGDALNRLLGRLEAGIARQRLFMANAAHELRTPIAVLDAKIDALVDAAPKREIKPAMRRLAGLLNQLLAATRIAHEDTALREEFDLVATARGVVADCAPLALRQNRAIELEAAVDRAPVRGSAQALASCIANIVDNALHVEPAGGTVRVSVRAASVRGKFLVDICDHGPGIALEDRRYVFDPFWRKDGQRQGSGLGLFISADIAARHGGTVQIADLPGWSTVFRIELPSI